MSGDSELREDMVAKTFGFIFSKVIDFLAKPQIQLDTRWLVGRVSIQN